jgi:ABC-2 type transport system permease protein
MTASGTARRRLPPPMRADHDPVSAAHWSTRRQLATNLRGVSGRAYPRVIGLLREPSWVLFEVLIPFLTTSAFVFVYRALDAPPEYVGFAVLGGAMTAFWLNVIWMMAAQLYWEKDQGNLDIYFTSPVNLMSVLLGMAIGGFVMTIQRAAVVLLAGAIVYEVRFSVDEWGLLIAVFLLTMAALYGLGMVLASVFLLFGREAWHLTQSLQEPVYFVSGLNFPVGRLGMLGLLAIAFIPLAVGLDAMRQLVFSDSTAHTGTPEPWIEALILVVMTVVSLVAARIALRKLEWMARHEGRLTMRGG